MLSRIAEALFWIGRYVERADDTARILDVWIQRILEDPWVDESLACRSLLSVMGSADPPDPATTGDVLDRLAFQHDSSGSIAGALFAARENARGTRETISTELWECPARQTPRGRTAGPALVPQLRQGTLGDGGRAG